MNRGWKYVSLKLKGVYMYSLGEEEKWEPWQSPTTPSAAWEGARQQVYTTVSIAGGCICRQNNMITQHSLPLEAVWVVKTTRLHNTAVCGCVSCKDSRFTQQSLLLKAVWVVKTTRLHNTLCRLRLCELSKQQSYTTLSEVCGCVSCKDNRFTQQSL